MLNKKRTSAVIKYSCPVMQPGRGALISESSFGFGETKIRKTPQKPNKNLRKEKLQVYEKAETRGLEALELA